MRVSLIAGARPNFVKIAPLMPALAEAGIEADIINTGQHYDALMADIFFTDLEIPKPRWSLGVGSGTHGQQTATALVEIEKVLSENRPDALIVVGDVNSTLAGALAATKLGIPLVHVEAGLRSWDPSMPEEINRILTDRVASLLITPMREANENLRREGAAEERIVFVGNIMAESLLKNKARALAKHACKRYGFEGEDFILSTCHRPENTDDPALLKKIIDALESAPLPVLLPAHPRTRPALAELGAGEAESNITVVDPVGYLDMLSLEADARVVVSDSGGVQEETCLLQTPCITARNNTERAITSECGYNVIAPPRTTDLARAIVDACEADVEWSVPELWDDQVSARIVAALLDAEKNGFPPIGHTPAEAG